MQIAYASGVVTYTSGNAGTDGRKLSNGIQSVILIQSTSNP